VSLQDENLVFPSTKLWGLGVAEPMSETLKILAITHRRQTTAFRERVDRMKIFIITHDRDIISYSPQEEGTSSTRNTRQGVNPSVTFRGKSRHAIQDLR